KMSSSAPCSGARDARIGGHMSEPSEPSERPPQQQPPPFPPPESPPAPPPPSPPPVSPRHPELADLPPAVAERLRFDAAAPRRLRSEKLPPAVRAELQSLWDGIAADVYDEVAGLRRAKALSSKTVERVLERVADRLLQAQRVI